jgi:hypothetical protein
MKIITEPKLKLELNKTEARGIRKVYQGMLELLDSPTKWIKGEFTNYDDDTGTNQYCLIGAADEVDGKWQETAEAFMYFNPPSGWEFKEIDPDDYLNGEISIDGLKATGRDEAIGFNDAKFTQYKDVVKWLRALIKKTDKIIAT